MVFIIVTLREAKHRVQKIQKHTDDNERAHSMEDKLYQDFIRDLAKGDMDPFEAREVAQELLKTRNFKFKRWYG